MTSPTTDRRLGLTGGTAIKAPCLCATTANITLSGLQTVDSVTVAAGNRVLVKNQTTSANNGVYVADTGTWTRDVDFDGASDIVCGTLVFVTNGSSNGAGLFQITTADPITIGTTSLTILKIATLAAGTVTQPNVQNGQFIEVASIAGTNTITGTTVGTAPAALGHGQYVFFVPANTNTGPTTFNRDGLGGVNVFYDGAALIGGELQALLPALLFHDGTQYDIVASSKSDLNFQTAGSVTAAGTVNLDTAKPYSQITGATPITAITLGNGRVRFVEFASTPVITNGASLICVTGGNITAAAGDTAAFIGEAASVVRMLFFQRADGSAVLAPQTIFSTGDVKLTIKTVADTGWVLMNDGTIGDATSGGTTRANADTSALFTLLWNNTVDADCAVSTGRGGSAAADFAAHKTIALPKALGRALATYGTGAGLTARTLAKKLGAETYQIATTDLPALTFAGVGTNWETVGGAAATVARGNGSSSTGSFNPGGTVNAGSPNTAISLMGPILFLNTMIKL